MNLQRKVYATRSDKVVDLVIGVVLWHIVNIVFGVILSIGFSFLSTFTNGDANLSNTLNIFSTILGCLPFLINIALLIYFGLTRYWIALGMLGIFALYLLLTICALVVFGVACFSILGGTNSGL